jgi:Protein-arginine deiminase (PAD)
VATDLEQAPQRIIQALVAPGNVNTIRISGLAGHIHANFDRQEGGQNVDPTNEDRRKPRILRPGAIILPNLDIDEDLAAPRARFSFSEVDALGDDKVNEGDDVLETTSFVIAEANSFPGNAVKVTLKLTSEDAERVRIWEIPSGKTSKEAVVRIGPGAGNEFKVEDTSQSTNFPAKGWTHHFIAEARTLAGDPKLKAPSTDVPLPPGIFRTPLPDLTGGSALTPKVNNSDTSKAIYDGKRAPGDVWLEVLHETSGGANARLNDVALLTIAPWLMTWNTLECQRIYVVYIKSPGSRMVSDPLAAMNDVRVDNHCMVWDLMNGCHAAGLGPAPNLDTTLPLTPSKPESVRSLNDQQFYIIDGDSVQEGGYADRWIQDEIEIGYCHAPHQRLHIVLHNPRGRGGLATFAEKHMAHPGLGVFNSVTQNQDSTDYGGNLEVSPPVLKTTPKFSRKDAKGRIAGPSCKAHDRPAPFGKIIIGDCKPRPCSGELHDFLQAQRVQPVLPIDTSWLSVGHTDEIMSFVRSNDSKGFRLLFARPLVMTLILEEVKKLDAAATLHAGKYREAGINAWQYDEDFVENWLSGDLYSYSAKVEREKLAAIRERLMTGLDIEEPDVLSIPTYFEVPPDSSAAFGNELNRTIASNVGMVNMQVVNNHLMVPRPFGPRLESAKAALALETILEKWFVRGVPPAPPMLLPSTDEHFFWARPGETLRQIAMYFARPAGMTASKVKAQRQKLIQKLKTGNTTLTDLDPAYQKAVEDLEQAILDEPWNKAVPTPLDQVAPAPDHTFTKWMRLKIPGNTVDVLEGFMKSILESLGNTVHFIDDFECYHAMAGEVHCGTNAVRKPPEEHAGFTARWWDAGNYDPDYDTSYDPAS